MTNEISNWYNLDKSKLIGKLFIVGPSNKFKWSLVDNNLIIKTYYEPYGVPTDKVFMILESPSKNNHYHYLFLMDTKIVRVYFEEFLYNSVQIT